jgi:hypothetical protein
LYYFSITVLSQDKTFTIPPAIITFLSPLPAHSYYFSNTIKGATDNDVDNNDNDGDSKMGDEVNDGGDGVAGDEVDDNGNGATGYNDEDDGDGC